MSLYSISLYVFQSRHKMYIGTDLK